ncbi:MAG: exopolyphosphatase [Halothiobacillaceae bacterium]|jgi:exopolyphosphatase/guanosine-5'-triphosphate,3'-diphosphate pyrophosphatase
MTDSGNLLAAIDLGSNSFHMVVMRLLPDGQVQVVDRLKEMVRLGGGLDEANNLSPEAAERALDCLARFGQRLRDMPRGSVRAVGTNTLRQAKNSAEFLRKAQQALGHPIEIIAGREEARLIYLGVAHTDLETDEKRLVVDIGGGSTEVIVGQGFTPEFMESMPLGCVSMTRRFLADGLYTRETLKRAESEARLETRPYEYAFRHHRWQRAVGASGTAKALAAVCQANGWCEAGQLTAEGLARIRKALIKAGRMEQLDLPGLSEERRPVFAGGFVVMQAVFDAFDIDTMHISEGALREGLIFDRIGRMSGNTVRSATLERLQRDFRVDRAHAQRVAETARRLFERVREDWNLDPEQDGKVLYKAALLHEIGMMLAHSGYHEHGAYILRYADMPGFTQQEQQRLAAIVLAHRRKLKKSWLNDQPDEWRDANLRLAALLRLAVTLHRSRSPREGIPMLAMEAAGNALRLDFPPGWLERHPLTRSDLEREAEYLAPQLRISFR